MKGFKLLNSVLERTQAIVVGMVFVFPAVALAGAPYLVKDIKPGSGTGGPIELTLVGDNLLCFSGDDGVAGRELWCSDGTEEGTYLVRDIRPGPNDSAPHAFREVDGLLFFQANDGTTGQELWVSDGTTEGTVLIDINPTGDSYPADINTLSSPGIAWNGLYAFAAQTPEGGRELWVSDGTRAGTRSVKDINPGFNGSDPEFLTDFGSTLLFQAEDELWTSDGTGSGTQLVKDTFPTGSGRASSLTRVGDIVFFVASDEPWNRELWKTDGTEAGTVKVKEIHPTTGSDPGMLFAVGRTLFFAAYDPDDDVELWKSDGTEAGTVRVKDINPTGWSEPGSYLRFAVGNSYFFSADDGTHGMELWVSDGTEAGTYMVKDIHPSSDSRPSSMANVNGTLYFSADDGTMGRELWQTDGTADGTVRVTDINPGPGDSNAGPDLVMNGRMFFYARDGVHGGELWGMVLPPAPIPAVSSWGMVVFALLFCVAGSIVVRRTYLCDG